MLLAPIMPVPEEGRESFYRRLLELSFLQTGEAALAIDRQTDTVYLRLLMGLEGIAYDDLAHKLHVMVSVGTEMRAHLRTRWGG